MSATSSSRRALWPHPFGELFDDSSSKPAATIHVLSRELGREPDALDYLERIMGALAGIDSPFLATLRGASRDASGRLALAYERLDGEDLGTALSRGAFSVERAVAVLRQLCRGLATAHAAGINHRALGPASIVLLREGASPDAVKIIDFGIAGVLGEAEPKYSALLPMTPERLLGFGTHTSEDVYLVGCIGYWMLAGAPPFAAEDGDSLRRRQAIEDVAPLRSIAKHVPTALARALEDALVKDPDDRTVDLAALELALVQAQRDAGITTPWDAHVEALTERARVLGECPAASGVFQSVSGRGGKRTPSGSHKPVSSQGAAANHSPRGAVVAVGPGAREAGASAMKMPRPKPAVQEGGKVVRPISVAPTPAEVKPVTAKPVTVKPVEVKPVEVKPIEAKPPEAKPIAMPAKPPEAKPIAMPAKPPEAKPVEAMPTKLAAAPRIPPPPRLTTRGTSARVDLTPSAPASASAPAPASPPSKDPATPTAATSLVGLSIEDVEALGAGLNLPEPPPPQPPAPVPDEVAAKADDATAATPSIADAPASVPTIEATTTAALADAAPPLAEPKVAPTPDHTLAMLPPIADRTDAEALLLVPRAERARPAWLVPVLASAGLVTVLALVYGVGASPSETPSAAAPVASSSTASPTAPTPTPSVATPAPTPSVATPAPTPTPPEIAVAAPAPTAPAAVTPAIAPVDPTAKPAAAPVDPLRQQLIRAKEARKKGKGDEAIAAYRAALRLDADNRTALRELSRLYFDAGNYDSAARYGKQLVAASNASASDRVALGDAYFKLGRTADAKAQYEKAAASGDATAKKRLAKLGG